MSNSELSQEVQSFIVSETQMALDLDMVPFDVWGCRAHVIMLCESGIVSKDVAAKILSALDKIKGDCQNGTFAIDPTRGAQLTLEKEVIENAGEDAGLSMHTARSRNDQVMVTELLYLREQMLDVVQFGSKILGALRELASEHVETVMPGYTHMQPGKPTTFAHWCLSYHDGLERVLQNLQRVCEQYDRNPLGAVESYGTSWPINRKLTAELLGFESVWEVPQDAISHRGFFQLEALAALSQLGLEMGKMATDLMLYCTFEFGMIAFGDEVAKRLHPITGSSVMAQKKNPDALELLRSIAPQIQSCYQSAFGLLSGLPSGYNRDSREIKEYMSNGLKKSNSALQTLSKVLSSIEVNKDRMDELVRLNYSLTTDLADYLSQKCGVPYRRVYKIVGLAVDTAMESGQPLSDLTLSEVNTIAKSFSVEFKVSSEEFAAALQPQNAVNRRNHVGGTSPETTKAMCVARSNASDALSQWVSQRREKIAAAQRMTEELAISIMSERVA